MKKVFTFLKHEFIEVLPPTLFFLVVFHVTAFIRGLAIQEFGITLTSAGQATVGALIVGKAILIANKFKFLSIFENHQQVITVLWKVFIYSLVVVLFQYLEHMIPLISEHGDFMVAHHHLLEHIIWPKFWATHIVMAVFLAFYVGAVEVIDVIGKERFWNIFMGRGVQRSGPKD